MEKREELGRKLWEKKYRFTFVRNPWDKVSSHYHFRVQTNQSNLGTANIGFNEWIRLTYGEKNPEFYDNPKMFMPQLDWLIDENNIIIVEFIGRFENLQEDFSILCKKIGRPCIELPHVKKSMRTAYKDHYNDSSIDIIAKYFEKDINYFGYTY